MTTGPEGKHCRFRRIQIFSRVKVRCVGDARSSGSWEKMQGAGKGGEGMSAAPASAGAVRSRFRMSNRRMQTLRLGGSRRARLQQSLARAGRWVVSVSGWAGVAVRSKAKVGLAFLREALKLLITGLHAPSSEMNMAGYHIGPYLDEVLVHRRLEMQKARRSKSLFSGAGAGRKLQSHGRSSKSVPTVARSSQPRGLNQATERIITFPGSRLARRRAPRKGLATIAESALESEVRI